MRLSIGFDIFRNLGELDTRVIYLNEKYEASLFYTIILPGDICLSSKPFIRCMRVHQPHPNYDRWGGVVLGPGEHH